MSKIKAFRINAFDTVTNEIEFYCKINDEEEKVLCNICIANDGIYYYRKGSQILTPSEKEANRNTYDASISMEDLKDIFEELIKAKFIYESDSAKKLSVKRKGKQVIIEAY